MIEKQRYDIGIISLLFLDKCLINESVLLAPVKINVEPANLKS